jgi:type I restriction enzyme S subunit
VTPEATERVWPFEPLAVLLEGGLFVDGDWVETKDQDPNGDVRLIQLADVGDGVFNDRSRRFLTSAKAAELKCTYLKPGDVLVARMPDPLGRAAMFPGVEMPAITAVDVCILRPPEAGPRPMWLVHAINAPQTRLAIERLARGTTRGRISRKNLSTLMIPAPPLPVQDQVLVHICDALEKLKRSEAQLDTARTAIGRVRRGLLAKVYDGELEGSRPLGESDVRGATRSQSRPGSAASMLPTDASTAVRWLS